MKGPALRASSRAGSRSSVMGCVSTATRPAPPRSPSRPRCSTECLILDARTPFAPHDQQRGMGAPLPLSPPCNTLDDVKTGGKSLTRDQSGGWPDCCPDGIQHEGGVTLGQALARNVGTCRPDAKELSASSSAKSSMALRAG